MDEKDLVRFITNETVLLLSHVNKKNPLDVDVIAQFIYNFTSAIMTKALRSADKAAMSDADKFKAVSTLFTKLKMTFQEQTALGFGKAMTDLTGKQVEYVCTINIMPKAKNTLPC
jgi:hypothetical protein